jgi:hypothetical protein
MTCGRPLWLGVAITTAAAAVIAGAAVQAMAAPHSARPGNYQGPARPARSAVTHQMSAVTNYRGPVRRSAPAAIPNVSNSNMPASLRARRGSN